MRNLREFFAWLFAPRSVKEQRRAIAADFEKIKPWQIETPRVEGHARAFYLWAAHGLPIGLGIVVYATPQSTESVGAAWSAIIGDVYATVHDDPDRLPHSSDVVPYEGLPGFWLPGGLRIHLEPEGVEQARRLGLDENSVRLT